MMTRITAVILFVLCLSRVAVAGEYTGNKLLEILGEDKTGGVFNAVKSQYLLDKSLKNPELGIKLTMTHDSVSLITAITLTSAGTEINDIKYKEYAALMPFNMSFDDGEEALQSKLGEGKGSEDDNKLKYKKDGITINVYFKNSSKKKIAFVKFTQNIGMIGPYRMDGSHEAPKVAEVKSTAVPTKATAAVKGATLPEIKSNPAKNVNALPSGASFGKSNNVAKASKSKFYNSIMNVIESGEEEMFKDIKRTPNTRSNFWNYKYTYATSISIPGEKYNMLYSFPFQKSQLDFVSVMEETDGPSPTIIAKYAEVEKTLKQDFPQSEGWAYHYIVNPEDPKGPKDFELKNAKLGSIVLDHSISPVGKRVLYVRFLLQYN